MGLSDDFKAVMVADTGAGGVNTLLTGGIYTFTETGRLGINSASTPSAFDTSTHKLKPCAIVKARDRSPDGGVVDDDKQTSSWRQVVQIFLYADGDGTPATLLTVADRLYALFHGRRVNKMISHYYHRAENEREKPLNGAHMVLIEFVVHSYQTVQ